MANESFQEYKKLVHEITSGLEQVKHLKAASSSGNQETALEKMLTSYEEALSILNGMDIEGQDKTTILRPSDPPNSSVAQYEDSVSGSKKRKSVARVATQVRAQVEAGSDMPLDDGYAWRKYGEKLILGSIYPRAYYRCARGKTCLARKQLQRSDSDPNYFEIVYRGTHTCMKPAPVSSLPRDVAKGAPTPAPADENPSMNDPIDEDISEIFDF